MDNIIPTDYDQIKVAIKNYLKNQTEFSDYNFEGSALSFLISILAYNSSYNAFIGNMLINETFLSLAQKRSNAVLRAKELGYTPSTAVAAKATIHIAFERNDSPVSVVLPKNTKFVTSIDGVSSTFITVEPYTFHGDSNNLYESDVDIYQGNLVRFVYPVSSDIANQSFAIPSKTIDEKFLKVYVKETAVSTNEILYTRASDITEIGPTSEIFFFEENFDGNYLIRFGDNIIGKGLIQNNIVIIEYLITDGKAGNEANKFSRVSSIGGSSIVTLTTVTSSAGGADKEDINTIKLLAPQLYQSQNRAVTYYDYIAIVKKLYANAEDVMVWGGEDNLPNPYYGKVFIAIKPRDGTYLSNNQKEIIKTQISKYNVVSVIPEIVDPDYFYIEINTKIKYDLRKITITSVQLEALVDNTITTFFDENLNLFGKNLQYSKLVASIDNSSDYIISNNTAIRIRKEESVITEVASKYLYYFSNAIEPYSLRSNAITIDGLVYYITDTPNGTAPFSTGTIVISRQVNNNTIYLNSNLGTIDYLTGVVTLNSLRISSTSDGYLKLTVTPAHSLNLVNLTEIDNNVNTNARNQIITLDNVTITSQGV